MIDKEMENLANYLATTVYPDTPKKSFDLKTNTLEIVRDALSQQPRLIQRKTESLVGGAFFLAALQEVPKTRPSPISFEVLLSLRGLGRGVNHRGF